jgi:hypothetical protein
MEHNTSGHNIRFYITLVLAIWFMVTSAAWTYLANVFISFPFGLIAFLLWINGRKKEPGSRRYSVIAGILIAGVVIAVLSLLYFYFFE